MDIGGRIPPLLVFERNSRTAIPSGNRGPILLFRTDLLGIPLGQDERESHGKEREQEITDHELQRHEPSVITAVLKVIQPVGEIDLDRDTQRHQRRQQAVDYRGFRQFEKRVQPQPQCHHRHDNSGQSRVPQVLVKLRTMLAGLVISEQPQDLQQAPDSRQENQQGGKEALHE